MDDLKELNQQKYIKKKKFKVKTGPRPQSPDLHGQLSGKIQRRMIAKADIQEDFFADEI